MEKKKIRAVAYIRVSTKKDEQKNSFENQQAHFQRILSEKEGFTLVSLPSNDGGIYADKGFSGTKLSRPAFDRMLYDAGLRRIIDDTTGKPAPDYSYRIECPSKFDIILVKDTSRFARDSRVIAILRTLRSNGVTVVFEDIAKSTGVSDDWSYIELFFNFAENESTQRSNKVKMGYAEGVRKGRIYAGSVPLGYDYVPINKDNPLDGNRLVANDKAIIVKTVFDLYEQGFGSKHIEQRLKHLGYTTQKGGRIDRSVILYILRNNKYTGENDSGKFTHGELFHKKLVPVPYDNETRVAGRIASAKISKKLAEEGKVQIEPIISKEQFDRVQELLNQQTDKFKKKTCNSYNPYAKKIKCAVCGAYCLVSQSFPLLDKDGRPVKDENGEIVRNRRYRCSNAYQYGKDRCHASSFDQKVIDNLLDSSVYYEMKLQMIEDLQGAGEMCTIVLNEALDSDNDQIVQELDSNINQLTEEKNRLLQLYARGLYDETELERLTQDYVNRIKNLNERRAQLSKSNDEIRKDIAMIQDYLKIAESEENGIRSILKDKQYEAIDRKQKLKEIDFISVNPLHDEPVIVFKTYSEIERVIAYIDSITERYDDMVMNMKLSEKEIDDPKALKILTELRAKAKKQKM